MIGKQQTLLSQQRKNKIYSSKTMTQLKVVNDQLLFNLWKSRYI